MVLLCHCFITPHSLLRHSLVTPPSLLTNFFLTLPHYFLTIPFSLPHPSFLTLLTPSSVQNSFSTPMHWSQIFSHITCIKCNSSSNANLFLKVSFHSAYKALLTIFLYCHKFVSNMKVWNSICLGHTPLEDTDCWPPAVTQVPRLVFLPQIYCPSCMDLTFRNSPLDAVDIKLW